MKYILPLFFALLIISCNKEEEVIESPTEGIIEKTADFQSSAHPTSGKVNVKNLNGKRKLELVTFKTDSGPDLRIYLAEDLKASGLVELKTGAPSGSYSVDIPDNTDLAKKKFVLIWCKSFSVLFGYAELK